MPGYQDNELVPYRRPAASELHRARQVRMIINYSTPISIMLHVAEC